MAIDRTSLREFVIDRPWYASHQVKVWAVDPDTGARTTTLAALYAEVSGAETLANPQTLTSRGRWKQPVYIDAPAELEIINIGTGETVTETGIVGANLQAEIVETAQNAANQALSYWQLAKRVAAQLTGAGISGFSFTILALTTAGDWLTGLGFSAFIKTLVDDADAPTARATLGAAASAITVTGTKSITGGGDLSANRTLELDGDEASPGNREFYGTSGAGAKGFRALAGEDLPDGAILQVVYAEILTNGDLTTAMPVDDSIPQSGEGTEILTVSITPKVASSKLLVCVDLWGGAASALAQPGIGLFVDSVADALAASFPGDTRNAVVGQWSGRLTKRLDAGSISARTYKVRIGNGGGTAVRLNGNTSGRFFGGVGVSSLVVMEIKA